MIPQQTQQQLNTIANRYANELLQKVQAVLSQPQYKNKGELLDSLKIGITPATNTEPPVIVLQYADQGYFIGYRNPQWTKFPNVENLLDWSETKTFNKIPGYSGTANIPDYKKRARVVYAIAVDKRKNDTHKPKRWKRAAGLGDLLKSINADVLAAYTKDVEEILANAIATGEVLS